MKKTLFFALTFTLLIFSISCNETDKTVDSEETHDTDNYIQDIDTQDEDPNPCDDGKKWHTPVTLTDNKIDGVFPKLTKLNDGVLLIYQQHSGSTSDGDYISNLYSRTYSSSTGWKEPVLIDSYEGEIFPELKEATDLKGDKLFILVQSTLISSSTVEFILYTYEYSIKNGWGGAVEIDSCNINEKYYSTFHLQNNWTGDAFVTWTLFTTEEEKENRKRAAFAKTYTSDVGWSETKIIKDFGDYDYISSSQVLNKNGDALIKVLTRKDDVYNQEIVRYLKNEGWQEPEEKPFEKFIGWMKTYNENDIFVTLYDPEGDSNELWSGRYTKDEGWVEDETILRTNINDIEDFDGFDLSINSKGNVISAWNYVYPTEYYQDGELWANIYFPEKGWKGEEKLETNTVYDHLASSVSENGDIFISWTEWRMISGLFDIEEHIWVKRYSPEVGWCPSEIVSEQIHADYSQIIVDDDGNAVMIWKSLENDISIIRAAEFY